MTAVVRPAPPAPAPVPLTPAQFVRRHYTAIDAGRFGQAWARLRPVVRDLSGVQLAGVGPALACD